jgi:hypothetical protein
VADRAAVMGAVGVTARAAVMGTVGVTVRVAVMGAVGETVRVAVIVARLVPADLRALRTTIARSAASKSRVARRSASY